MVTIIGDKKVSHVEDSHHEHMNLSLAYCQKHINLLGYDVFRQESSVIDITCSDCVDELMRRLEIRKKSLLLDN